MNDGIQPRITPIHLESLQPREAPAAPKAPAAPPVRPARRAKAFDYFQFACIIFAALTCLILVLIGELATGRAVADLVRGRPVPPPLASSAADQHDEELLAQKNALEEELRTLRQGDERARMIGALRDQIRVNLKDLDQLRTQLKVRDDELTLSQKQKALLEAELTKSKVEVADLTQKLANPKAPLMTPGTAATPIRVPLQLNVTLLGKEESFRLEGWNGAADCQLSLKTFHDRLAGLAVESGSRLVIRYNEQTEVVHPILELRVVKPATGAAGPPMLVGRFLDAARQYHASTALRQAIDALNTEALLVVRSNDAVVADKHYRLDISIGKTKK